MKTYNTNIKEKKETLTWAKNQSGKYVWHYLLLKVTKLHWKKIKSNDQKQKNNSWMYNAYHGPLSQEWTDRRYWPQLRYILTSSRSILSGRLYSQDLQHPRLKTTYHTRIEKPFNDISTLESPNMLKNWNPNGE